VTSLARGPSSLPGKRDAYCQRIRRSQERRHHSHHLNRTSRSQADQGYLKVSKEPSKSRTCADYLDHPCLKNETQEENNQAL
jgi:hypothetical protein